MNINKLIIPKVNDCTLFPINSRAKLDTGTECNYKCSFCYYIDKLDQVTPLDTIIQRIEFIHKAGIKEIDLSGGESSIHNDWIQILELCNKKFDHISTLSNGSNFKYKYFLHKSKSEGLKEVLFSLHGWDENSHDKIVNTKGAFKGIIHAIYNTNALDMVCRINCTVTNNFDEVKYCQLINSLNITQLNLLPMNYWGKGHQQLIDYKLISEKMKYLCNNINQDIELNIRYMPLCHMEGYEKYIVGMYQHIFDIKDWNIVIYNTDSKTIPVNDITTNFDRAYNNRLYWYQKSTKCLNCKYLYICDGVENKYKNFDFQPVQQDEEKIKDVMFYRSKHSSLL